MLSGHRNDPEPYKIHWLLSGYCKLSRNGKALKCYEEDQLFEPKDVKLVGKSGVVSKK